MSDDFTPPTFTIPIAENKPKETPAVPSTPVQSLPSETATSYDPSRFVNSPTYHADGILAKFGKASNATVAPAINKMATPSTPGEAKSKPPVSKRTEEDKLKDAADNTKVFVETLDHVHKFKTDHPELAKREDFPKWTYGFESEPSRLKDTYPQTVKSNAKKLKEELALFLKDNAPKEAAKEEIEKAKLEAGIKKAKAKMNEPAVMDSVDAANAFNSRTQKSGILEGNEQMEFDDEGNPIGPFDPIQEAAENMYDAEHLIIESAIELYSEKFVDPQFENVIPTMDAREDHFIEGWRGVCTKYADSDYVRLAADPMAKFWLEHGNLGLVAIRDFKRSRKKGVRRHGTASSTQSAGASITYSAPVGIISSTGASNCRSEITLSQNENNQNIPHPLEV